MLTIFACPKAFSDPHIDRIQRNAIRSWLALRPAPKVLLFGDDAGVTEAAVDLGVTHISGIARTDQGTPLLSDIFAKAYVYGSEQVRCYVNSDIILMSDFARAIERLQDFADDYLLVGRRWRLDVAEDLEIGAEGWQDQLQRRVRQNGYLDRDYAIDYFAFKGEVFREIPAFAIGRTKWDNWLIWRARDRRIPVVDLTSTVMAVHQNHDYSHFGGERNVWDGSEARLNRSLAGEGKKYCTLQDATHVLLESGIRSTWRYRLRRKIGALCRELLVYRTGRVRHALGLRRASLRAVSRWLGSRLGYER